MAACTFTLPGGDHTVTATYLGDDKFNSNTTSSVFTVKDHKKINTTITTSVNVVNSTVTLTVNVNESAAGFVEISIAGKKYYVPVDTGKAVFSNDYSAGTYAANITYLGDDNFNIASDSVSFTVIEYNITKMNTTINIAVESAENNVTITVNVNENATGLVEFNIDGDSVYIPVNNGVAVCEFVFSSGDYTVTATYIGDDKFNANVTSENFTVVVPEKQDTNVSISIPSDIKVGDSPVVEISIPNATGEIVVIVDGEKITVPLDENGTASVMIPEITAGDHNIVVIYSGDDTHAAAYNATKVSVKVTPTKFVNITIFSDLNITAVLVDEQGNPVANAPINYAVGNVNGSTVTSADGSFVIAGANGALITIDYAGSASLLATNTTLKLEDVAPPALTLISTQFNFTSVLMIKGYAVDVNAEKKVSSSSQS